MSILEYIKYTKKNWKFFYFFLCLYFVAILFCTLILKHSVPPFYVYSMYSYPIPKEAEIIIHRIIVNEKEIDTFQFFKEEGDVIRANIIRYSYLKKSSFKDKFHVIFEKRFNNQYLLKINDKLFNYKNLDEAVFGNWLRDYLQSHYKRSIESIKIYETTLMFTKEQRPLILKEALILNKKYE